VSVDPRLRKSVLRVTITRRTEERSFGKCQNLSVQGFFFLKCVAVFRKPNAIPLCFSMDLVLNFLLSWLLVLLPSTFFLDVLFSFVLANIQRSFGYRGAFDRKVLSFSSCRSLRHGLPFKGAYLMSLFLTIMPEIWEGGKELGARSLGSQGQRLGTTGGLCSLEPFYSPVTSTVFFVLNRKGVGNWNPSR